MFGTIGKIAIAAVVGKFVLDYATRQVEVGKPTFKVLKADFNGVRIGVTIPVTNRLMVDAKINGFVGALAYSVAQANGVYKDFEIGKLIVPQSTVLKHDQAVDLQASLLINYADLSTQVADAISSGSILGKIKLKGVLLAAGARIPVNTYLAIA